MEKGFKQTFTCTPIGQEVHHPYRRDFYNNDAFIFADTDLTFTFNHLAYLIICIYLIYTNELPFKSQLIKINL